MLDLLALGSLSEICDPYTVTLESALTSQQEDGKDDNQRANGKPRATPETIATGVRRAGRDAEIGAGAATDGAVAAKSPPSVWNPARHLLEVVVQSHSNAGTSSGGGDSTDASRSLNCCQICFRWSRHVLIWCRNILVRFLSLCTEISLVPIMIVVFSIESR